MPAVPRRSQVSTGLRWPQAMLLLALAVTLAVAPALAPTARAQTPAPLETPSGLLQGVAGEADGVTAYRGVPYALPPIGDRRWQPPAPAAPWTGVRAADAFGPGCMQHVAGSRPPWTEPFMHNGPVSEDCLYLNVWTAAPAGADRPVLVYIHGGGFNEGSGSVPVYDGAPLARAGLVVVTINYRLGAFGFLAHPALTAEAGASGNYGLMDALAALRWVQTHIAAFGGDPGRVTVAGQSAGAMAAYLLTASPEARGLLHRAVVQSGPGGLASFGVASAALLAGSLAEAEAAGAAFAARFGADDLAALRAVPAESLLAGGGGPPVRFRPVVDGRVLPAPVPEMFARGEALDVPLLTGLNADESSAFPGYGTTTRAAFREAAEDRYGGAADRFLALYPAADDDAAGAADVESRRHLGAVALARLAAEREPHTTAPAYLYYFDRAIPWPEYPNFGAFHTAEVPYVFGTLDRLDRPWTAVDRRLSETMMAYWVRFAAAGDPNGPGLPPWPTFTARPDALMGLGADVGPRVLPGAEQRAFFEAVLARPAGR